MTPEKELDSKYKLIELGLEPDDYPAEAIFGNIIGTFSKYCEAVCILINDNFTESEQEDLDNLIIPLETLKEIALTVKVLITNFGIDVHSHTLKNDNVLNKLKIKKI